MKKLVVFVLIAVLVMILTLQMRSPKPAAPTHSKPAAVAAPAATPAVESRDRSAEEARLEECREKLKTAQKLDLLTNMTFEGGRPKVWVGRTWHQIPIDAKTGFAETAHCFFMTGRTDAVIRFPIYDGMTGKEIARWTGTRLEVE